MDRMRKNAVKPQKKYPVHPNILLFSVFFDFTGVLLEGRHKNSPFCELCGSHKIPRSILHRVKHKRCAHGADGSPAIS